MTLREQRRHLNATSTASTRSARARAERGPAQIAIADVLALYAEHVAPTHARPKEALQHIKRLAVFFGDKTLADMNGELCRTFVRNRKTQSGARRDLTILRAAINFHREEGLLRSPGQDRNLPEKETPRDRWLTRARRPALIRQAWRYREIQKGHPTGRRSRQHVARFILVALYTGTRAGAVCGAAFEHVAGAGYIDLDRGIFYRRPAGAKETKKRQPPVPLPRRLLAHLRRWQRLGQRYCVEFNGAPIKGVDKAFRRNAEAAGMPEVTPHTLRHTAATWLMQRRADLWEAAGLPRHERRAARADLWPPPPDHLKSARDAFDRRPGRA